MSVQIIPPTAAPVVVVPGDASRFVNFGLLSAAVVSAVPGRVFSAQIDNTVAAIRYFQLFNKTTAPVLADVPFYVSKVPASSQVIIGSDFFGPPLPVNASLRGGLVFPVGISWGWSTTEGTYTAAAALSHVTFIMFSAP